MPRPPHPAPHPAGEHDATSTAWRNCCAEPPTNTSPSPQRALCPAPRPRASSLWPPGSGVLCSGPGPRPSTSKRPSSPSPPPRACARSPPISTPGSSRCSTSPRVTTRWPSWRSSAPRRPATCATSPSSTSSSSTSPQATTPPTRPAKPSIGLRTAPHPRGGSLFLVAAAVERALAATRLAGFFVTAARVAVLVALVTALVGLGIYSHSEAASTLAGNLILVLPLFTIVSLTEDMISGYRAMAAARAISLLSFFTALATGFALVSPSCSATPRATRAPPPASPCPSPSPCSPVPSARSATPSTWAAPGASSHPRAPSTHSSRSSSPPDWPPGPWASPPPASPAAPRTRPEGENWPAASTASWCTPNVSAIPQHTTTLSAYNNTRSTSAAKHRPLAALKTFRETGDARTHCFRAYTPGRQGLAPVST